MISIDISQILLHPDRAMPFSWEGQPDFCDPVVSAPVKAAGELRMQGENVRLTGTLKTELALTCARCLAPVAHPVEKQLDELFMPSVRDGEAYPYDRETKRLSLDQMIYDILSVDIPLQVLCSETCRGLCPQCGKNLNEGPCACSADTDPAGSPDNPFAILKDLF